MRRFEIVFVYGGIPSTQDMWHSYSLAIICLVPHIAVRCVVTRWGWNFKKRYDTERLQQHINLLVVTAYQIFFISPSYVIYFSFERKARLTFYGKVCSFSNKTSNSIIELIIELYPDTSLYINRSIYLPYFISEFNYYNCIWYIFIDDYCRPLDLHKIQRSKSFSFLD